MREIRPSGSEGGARLIPRPYPYFSVVPLGLGERTSLRNLVALPVPGRSDYRTGVRRG